MDGNAVRFVEVLAALSTPHLIMEIRAAIDGRDAEERKVGGNAILHQAFVYRVAALERELAIRNAREQAQLDAEARTVLTGDQLVQAERIKTAVMEVLHAHDGVMLSAGECGDIARSVVAYLDGAALPPTSPSLATRLRVLVERWDREYGTSTFARDLTEEIDGADVGPIATRCPPEQPGDLGADVLESLIPDPVDVGPDPSGTLIDEIAARLVTVTRGHLVALVLEVQRRRSERDADKRIAAEIQTEIERMTKLLEHAKMAREPGTEQSALDAEFLRRVTSRTKHGPLGSGTSGACSPDCVKCEAERRLKEMTDG